MPAEVSAEGAEEPALAQPRAQRFLGTLSGVTGRPAAGRPDAGPLARCVGDPDAFAAQHWGRAPLLTRDRGGFRDLLDLDGVDELLSRRGLRTPFIRMAKAGEVLDSSAFTAPGGVGAEIGDQVRDDKVAALFGDGATVVLQALHRNWPPMIEFCTRLAAELGHPVQANAYVTPPASRGFSAHYDVHDVFVLQLAGRKHWTIHAPVLTDPLRDQPWSRRSAAVAAAAQEQAVIDTVLEPGDALYLPRGWLHAATALGEVSAHLTVGVHVVTRFALVEALTALLATTRRCARRCRWASTWPTRQRSHRTSTPSVRHWPRPWAGCPTRPWPGGCAAGCGPAGGPNPSAWWRGRRSPPGSRPATSCACASGCTTAYGMRASRWCWSCRTGRSACRRSPRRLCARC